MDIRKTRTECYLRNPKSTFELHILLSADRNRHQAFDWTIIRVIIEHIITLAPYCPVTLYHRWPGVQDGKVGSMSPLPKLRPRVVYFQAAARNPPTTSLARLRIWPFPCPSTQMPELATVSPGWQPWWQRPSGLHPHHPRDAATPTVSAADACVMRQGVDGSSLWRLFRAFPG